MIIKLMIKPDQQQTAAHRSAPIEGESRPFAWLAEFGDDLCEVKWIAIKSIAEVAKVANRAETRHPGQSKTSGHHQSKRQKIN